MKQKTIYELLKEKNDKNVNVSFANFCAYRAKKSSTISDVSIYIADYAAAVATYAANDVAEYAAAAAEYAASAAERELQRKFLKMFDIKA
jgi:hypothetical protein